MSVISVGHQATEDGDPPRDEPAILSAITKPLREEICIHKCQKLLSRLHVLDGAELGLRGALSQALQPVVFVAGDVIIHEGDLTEAMYFILHGKVEVYRQSHGEAPITTLGAGSLFGSAAPAHVL